MAFGEPAIEVAVIGVGYMGRKHAERYHRMPGVKLAGVVDTEAARARKVGAECGCPAWTSVEHMLSQCAGLRAASVAVPTIYHAQIARTLFERGIACLIEKPMAPSLHEAEDLAELADRVGAVVQVGHIERFNPAIRSVQRLGVEPLMIKSDRVSRMPFRSLDIDVVLDVMIHDLDLALLFTGADPAEVEIEARAIALDHHPEHIANARLLFPSGCLADLTASRVALSTKREIRLFTRDSYFSIDCKSKRTVLIREAEYIEGLRAARERMEQGEEISEEVFRDLVQARDLVSSEESRQDALTEELTAFIAAVREGRPTAVDIRAGLRALALAEKVANAMRRN